MESETTPVQEQKSSWNTVTPLSKYLAMALFVSLPFIGGFVGYMYAPEKVRVVEVQIPIDVQSQQIVATEKEEKSSVYELDHIPSPELRINGDGPFGVVDPEKMYLKIDGNLNLLKTVSGQCDVVDSIDSKHLIGEGFITDTNQIVSQIRCWFGGGGSDTALVNVNDSYKVLYYETGECGASVDCKPNGSVEVLYVSQ